MTDQIIESLPVGEKTLNQESHNPIEDGSDIPTLDYILKQIENNKHLPISDRDYFKIYLLLEDFITKNHLMVKQQFSKEQLRALIKKEFNTLMLPSRLSLFFNVEKAEQCIFCGMFLEEAFVEVSRYIDVNLILKKFDITMELGKPDFESFEKRILYHTNKKNITEEMRQALSKLYQFGIESMGEDKIKPIFHRVFTKIYDKYGFSALFVDALRDLPKDVFNEEKRKILHPQAATAAAVVHIAKDLIRGAELQPYLDRCLDRIEESNSLPLKLQADSFFNIYTDLENLIIKKEPREISIRILREQIREQVNIEELPPYFEMWFLSNRHQLIKLTEEFLSEFIKKTSLDSKINLKDVKDKITGILPLLDLDKQGHLKSNIYIDNIHHLSKDQKDDNFSQELTKYLNFFYKRAVTVLNTSEVNEAVRLAYQSMQQKFYTTANLLLPLLPTQVITQEEKDLMLDNSYKLFLKSVIDQISNAKLKNELVPLAAKVNKSIENNGNREEALANFLESVVHKVKPRFGNTETERIFEQSYSEVKETYGSYPFFNEILNSVPRGYLEIERFNVLSKEELQKVSIALKKTESLKSDFTNMAAHELRTPLVSILGYSKRLCNDKKLPKKYKRQVEIIYKNAERQQKLVNNLLDISKFESGEIKLDMEYISIAALVKEIIDSFSPQIKERKLILKHSISGNLPRVYGDVLRLSQVISNLLANAIAFTPKGYIKVSVKLNNEQVQVAVSDSGVGLSKESQSHVFSKFYQVQDISTRKIKGSGLGLTICEKIILAHNGNMQVESKGLNKGSTFTFTIPATRKKSKKDNTKAK